MIERCFLSGSMRGPWLFLGVTEVLNGRQNLLREVEMDG